MSAARPAWRLFAAILQIVAFVVFTLPGPAHANAGHARPTPQSAHVHGAHAHAAGQVAQAHRHDASAAAAILAERADENGVRGAFCPSCSCCCQVFDAGPGDGALPFRWTGARPMPPPADRAYASLTPEALPEPPRPFA